MTIIQLPGLIDIHVQVRQLDANYLEDFDCLTAAAIAGGITLICVMPNTVPQIIDQNTFNLIQEFASNKARCDYALYFGASDSNSTISCEYITEAAGLNMNLSNGIHNLNLTDIVVWIKHLLNWPKRALGPIVCIAERHSMAAFILLGFLIDRRIHISQISKKDEILLIRAAKDRGIKITCDVSPHHLFLCADDIHIKACRDYKYELNSREDQKALWDNLDYIDIFATQHSAYTTAEKQCYHLHGFPGLETMLPLLLNAIAEGRLTKEDLIKKLYTNPKKIFNLPDQYNTYITVDLKESWVIPEETNYSKVKWTPFAGKKIKGKICQVVLRGKLVYRKGKVLAPLGYGENVRSEPYNKFICHCQDQQVIKLPKEC